MCSSALIVISSPPRLAEQLDPSAEARERSAELVRRLARHARPHLLAIGAAARAERVDAGEQEQRDEKRLQERNDAQPAHQRRVAEVNRSRRCPRRSGAFCDRASRDVSLAARGEFERRASNGRFAVSVGFPPLIGEDQRHAGLADVLATDRAALLSAASALGIVQSVVHARVHQADARRLAPQLANDALRVDDVPEQAARRQRQSRA